MNESGAFAGRTILVSGAGSGIGRSIALELAAQGAALVLCGRTLSKLEDTRQQLPVGSKATVLALDLTQLGQILPAVIALTPSVGRLYGLCHSAGIVQTLPLAASTPERVQAMMTTNFSAGLELCRAFARRDVLDERGGSILWISSVYAHTGAPGQTGYSASKGAIAAAARSLALELAPRQVRVNVVSPGFVRTPMTEGAGARMTNEQWAQIEAMHPLGSGEPRDVARAAAFLLDPRNRWITGSDLVIDGGYTLR